MTQTRIIRVAITLSALCVLAGYGCKKESEPAKPAGNQPAVGAPAAPAASNAQGADLAVLRKRAEDLVAQIRAKQGELKALLEKLKAVAPADMLGPKGQELNKEKDDINASISSLTDQLNQVTREMKDKGGDTSGLMP